ncbi:MAG TPA: hypothetical protein VHR88_10200 [Solirubrobacteraceae bacterium]|nr:hypothetical protein [Solirubrobacteraceae bacterium]
MVAAAGVCLLAPAGCGGPAGDIFAVQRGGSIPDARVRLVVADDGTVTCNGGPARQMGDPRLLTARSLGSELDDSARGGHRLAPGRASVLSYRVLLPSGTLVYEDSSPHQTKAMLQLQGFVRDVAQHVCGLPR